MRSVCPSISASLKHVFLPMLTELCTKKATATDATESTVQRYSITEQMTQ